MKRPDENILIEFQAQSENDSDFAAYGRYLQSKWRAAKKIPMGVYNNRKGECIALGNYIDKKYSDETIENECGGNFLSPKIWRVVKDSIKNKEKGAKIEVNRLYRNLLSSQPLAFNLFGELSADTDNKLATKYFSELFPDRIKEVTKILFEHSPGRRDCEYTCDSSAFDVFVKYISPIGQNGFAGIEVKYAENLRNAPSSHKARYEELTNATGFFKVNSIESLKQKPIQQIWRDHLLSISILKHKIKKYQDGFFIYLYPKDNIQCENGIQEYIEKFKSFNPTTKKHDEKSTGFYPRYMKNFMIKLQQLVQDNWTNELLQRYFGDTDLTEEIWQPHITQTTAC